MGYLDNVGLAHFYAGLKERFATKAAATQAAAGLMAAADKDKLDGIAAGANLAPNQNLLDNWDFRNPVNQRGVSTFTLNQHGLDRWRLFSGTCAVGSGYITLNGHMGQMIESSPSAWPFNGRPCTLSVMLADGTVKSVTLMPSATADIQGIVDGITSRMQNGSAWKVFSIITSSATQIAAVKLEAGTVSTLAQDAPMDYATALAKCQRYFYRYTGRYFVGKWNDVYNYANFSFPTTMRVAPAISNVISEQGWGTVSVFSADAQSIAFAASGNVGSCLGFDAIAEL